MAQRPFGTWGKIGQYIAISVIVVSSLSILYSVMSARTSPVLVAEPVSTPMAAVASTTAGTALDPLAEGLAVASTTVHIGTATIRVAVVDTPAAREQGLGGVTGLLPNEGMLFVFQKDSRYAFWMKDMTFSIDMVWIGSDKRIVYIAKNVSPDTYPKPFVPTSPARYVLELPAGFADSHNLKIGESVSF